jgi:hypothetical protein
MMTKNIKINADFLFTGAKVQIKYYFRDRLTKIITELKNLFKQVNPLEKALDASLSEFLQTLNGLSYRSFLIQTRLGIELVCITNHLFLKGVGLIIPIERKWQMLGHNLIFGETCTRMAFTDLSMAHKTSLTQQLTTYPSVTDIRLSTKALDAGGIASEDTDIVEHSSLLQELRIQLEFRMFAGNQQTTVGHLATVH